MRAMFESVKKFAAFNAKPRLFSFSEPYQLACHAGTDGAVFIDLTAGKEDMFKARVEQLGGVVLTSGG